MATIRFNDAALGKKSWVANTWNRVTDLFGHTTSISKCVGFCTARQESELGKLQQDVYDLCTYALQDLLPKAGAYQQALMDTVLQASTVYSPEEAQLVFDEGNATIEIIKSHIRIIRYNIELIQEACDKAESVSDAQTRIVVYNHSVMPLVETLRTNIRQLEQLILFA
ncbi:glutamine synthetase [Parabacteroides sp. OttesenSCG-928-G21]|nr:glutamine synthetase [Parabacteroides sp. OttesenSCG-928-G21]